MARGPLARGRPDTSTANWRARMAQLFKNVATEDDIMEVMEHVMHNAKVSDDIQWAQLFLAYTIGKPSSQDDVASSRLMVDGDLNIQINQLSADELRVLKNLNVYDTLPDPDPLALEGEAAPAS